MQYRLSGKPYKMGEDRKAYIKYPKDCWGCSSCLKECKFEAIALYLGADMGGMGSKMSVTTKGDYLNWNIDKQMEAGKQSLLIRKNPISTDVRQRLQLISDIIRDFIIDIK